MSFELAQVIHDARAIPRTGFGRAGNLPHLGAAVLLGDAMRLFSRNRRALGIRYVHIANHPRLSPSARRGQSAVSRYK
jgi:hypothetical protein